MLAVVKEQIKRADHGFDYQSVGTMDLVSFLLRRRVRKTDTGDDQVFDGEAVTLQEIPRFPSQLYFEIKDTVYRVEVPGDDGLGAKTLLLQEVKHGT